MSLNSFFQFFVPKEKKFFPLYIQQAEYIDKASKLLYQMIIKTDLQELEDLANYVSSNSLCGLGQCSPNPVLSTLRHFKDEYIEHINGHCRAGVCKNLTKYEIDKGKCVGCSMCFRNCPVHAISGEVGKKFEIDPNICIKCGKCFEVCRFGAVKRS